MRIPAALGLGAAALLAAGWHTGPPALVEASPGRAAAALTSAAPRTTVVLKAGRHAPLVVTRADVTVVGEPGAVVRGPLRVEADGVTLRDLRVEGGPNGVTVRGGDGVRLEGVRVRGADLHGIEVVDASARITGCRVSGLRSPYAQGVEVRNTSAHPRSVVEGCRLTGGQEGLVTHSARVELRDNAVRDTSMRAVAITEMSEGIMAGNVVEDAAGVALYCGDMSHCEIRGNRVASVRPDGSGVRSRQGYGVVGWYYSTLRVRGNDLTAPRDVGLFLGSVTTDRFPLGLWAHGWRGGLLAGAVAGMSLVGLLAVRAITGMALRRRRERRAPGLSRDAATILAVGTGVQLFHVLEHAVQVTQVHALASASRSGILGSIVDTEWLHLGYNAAMLAFLGWVAVLCWQRFGISTVARAAPWVGAALLIQTYHLAEHVAKIVQHVATGVATAPGIVGGKLGLVWFHYGINVAVTAGLVVGAVALLRLRRARPAMVPA
jgi:hypothetical protein